MRVKILILWLICLFIFAYCNSPADPEIRKALDSGLVNLSGSINPSEQEELLQAVLEIVTIPEVPVLHYYSGMDSSQGRCTLVVTETNGVGGYVKHISMLNLFKLTFKPLETVSTSYNICANGRPTAIAIRLEGYDDNDFEIDIQTDFLVIIEN